MAPQPSEADLAQLGALFSARRHAEAEARAREMIRAWPGHPTAWQVLAMILGVELRHAEALPLLHELRWRWPSNPETYVNLGNTLRSLARQAEAVDYYRQAIELLPAFTAAHRALGETLKDLGRLPEAEQSYRHALELDPDKFAAYGNLGNVLLALGRLAEAEASMRSAIALRPDSPQGHAGLANVLRELGRLAEAEDSNRRALELNSASHVAHNNLGDLCYSQGRYADAIAHFRRAIELKPDFHHAHNNLGASLHALAHFNEAVRCYHRAIEIKPDFHEAHNNLGRSLLVQGNSYEAAASCRHSLKLKPDYEMAHGNLGNVLLILGELSESAASLRRALELKPDLHYVHSNLLFCLSHDERMDAKTLLAEHLGFAKVFEAPVRDAWLAHANTKDPERKLQVGFVSGDYREHAVAYFVEPTLAALAGNPRLTLHAYSNHPVEDQVTRRLQGHFAHWNRVAGMQDADLAEKICADGIDILIDLSGHTGQHRLLTFARKPAPVQASGIGYPGTTGLSAMDYYLADRFYLPRRQFEAQFTEKIVHLPAYASFRPAESAPAVNSLPALSNGFVTFGSFNRQSKISPSVIQAWSKILRSVPGSRMVLGALAGVGSFELLAAQFAREGVAPERLSFYTQCSLNDYLGLYGQIDLCLDTFAYTGGTTTLHALWMGVPTLTIAGNLPPRRLGAVIANHAGLKTFVARDEEDFVKKGVRLAGDLPALAKLRAGLRERFSQSALGQPALVAAGLERAMRIMWQRWCKGLPAEPFDVD